MGIDEIEMKRTMHMKEDEYDGVKSNARTDGAGYDDGNSKHAMKRAVEVNNDSKGNEVEERINTIVVTHLKSILGEHTLKVINYHLNTMGIDICRACNEPEKVEGVLYSLFKESSRMLISEVVNALYIEFNVVDGKGSTLEDAIKRIKAIAVG